MKANNENHNVLLTVLSSFGFAFGIVMIFTIIAVMCSIAYAFFNETTLNFPFDCFSVIGGEVDGEIGVQINYQNTLFSLITIIFIVLGVFVSGIKLFVQNKKLDHKSV